jgi:hypothetical protein
MAIPVAPPSFRWHRFRLAETDASDHASAACYRRFEHVGTGAIVVPELNSATYNGMYLALILWSSLLLPHRWSTAAGSGGADSFWAPLDAFQR